MRNFYKYIAVLTLFFLGFIAGLTGPAMGVWAAELPHGWFVNEDRKVFLKATDDGFRVIIRDNIISDKSFDITIGADKVGDGIFFFRQSGAYCLNNLIVKGWNRETISCDSATVRFSVRPKDYGYSFGIRFNGNSGVAEFGDTIVLKIGPENEVLELFLQPSCIIRPYGHDNKLQLPEIPFRLDIGKYIHDHQDIEVCLFVGYSRNWLQPLFDCSYLSYYADGRLLWGEEIFRIDESLDMRKDPVGIAICDPPGPFGSIRGCLDEKQKKNTTSKGKSKRKSKKIKREQRKQHKKVMPRKE